MGKGSSIKYVMLRGVVGLWASVTKQYMGVGGVSGPALRNDFLMLACPVMNMQHIALIARPFFGIFQKHFKDKPAVYCYIVPCYGVTLYYLITMQVILQTQLY